MLLPTISLEVANDATYIRVTDTTGTSSDAGTTKWSSGGSNNNFAKSDINKVLLEIYVGNSTTKTTLTPSVVSYLPVNSYDITPSDLSLTSDTLPDSMYRVIYMALFNSFDNSITVVKDSKNITVNSSDKTILVNTGVTHISISNVVYEIDKTATASANSTTVVLTTPYTGDSATITVINVLIGNLGEARVLNSVETLNCITKKVGNLTTLEGCCSTCKSLVIRHHEDLTIARYNFDLGLYEQAQEAIEFVNRKCKVITSSNCTC